MCALYWRPFTTCIVNIYHAATGDMVKTFINKDNPCTVPNIQSWYLKIDCSLTKCWVINEVASYKSPSIFNVERTTNMAAPSSSSYLWIFEKDHIIGVSHNIQCWIKYCHSSRVTDKVHVYILSTRSLDEFKNKTAIFTWLCMKIKAYFRSILQFYVHILYNYIQFTSSSSEWSELQCNPLATSYVLSNKKYHCEIDILLSECLIIEIAL
jgi:hypothetical protein